MGNIFLRAPFSRKYSYTKKKTKQTPPTIIGVRTCAETQGYVDPPQAVPRIMRPTPKINRIVPMMSRVARAGRREDRRVPERE